MKKYIIEESAWQEACNGIRCYECSMLDGKACRIAEYIQKQPIYKEPDRPHEDLGKWDISVVRCPECLEYFDLDVYPKEKLYKCPNCRADMHIGKGAAE